MSVEYLNKSESINPESNIESTLDSTKSVDDTSEPVQLTELETLILILKRKFKNKDRLINVIKYPSMLIDTLEELNSLVGMERLKDSISLQVMRLIDGLISEEYSSKMLNTILYGPPGVGKTKVGIILAKIWYSLGYLNNYKKSKSTATPNYGGADDNSAATLILLVLAYGSTYILQFFSFIYNKIGLYWLSLIIGSIILVSIIIYVTNNSYDWVNSAYNSYSDVNVDMSEDRELIKVVSRQDFVAEYVGQTATKTKKLLNENLGKVLFIDEAYSLMNDVRDPYGLEALTTLNLFMSENPNIIVIFAGYKNLMQQGIFSAQPGLPRRCMWHFECSGYNGEELSEIFLLQVNKDKWSISSKDIPKIKMLIMKNESSFPSYGGDTERLLFFSQLESSRSNLTSLDALSDSSSVKTLTYNNVCEGLKNLKENNIAHP